MSNKRLMFLLFVAMVMTDSLPQWPDPWAWSWLVFAERVLNVACMWVCVQISEEWQ